MCRASGRREWRYRYAQNILSSSRSAPRCKERSRVVRHRGAANPDGQDAPVGLAGFVKVWQ